MRLSRLVDQHHLLLMAVVTATAIEVPGSRCGPPESPRQTPPSCDVVLAVKRRGPDFGSVTNTEMELPAPCGMSLSM